MNVIQILTFFLAKLSGREEEERTTLMKSRDLLGSGSTVPRLNRGNVGHGSSSTVSRFPRLSSTVHGWRVPGSALLCFSCFCFFLGCAFGLPSNISCRNQDIEIRMNIIHVSIQ